MLERFFKLVNVKDQIYMEKESYILQITATYATVKKYTSCTTAYAYIRTKQKKSINYLRILLIVDA